MIFDFFFMYYSVFRLLFNLKERRLFNIHLFQRKNLATIQLSTTFSLEYWGFCQIMVNKLTKGSQKRRNARRTYLFRRSNPSCNHSSIWQVLAFPISSDFPNVCKMVQNVFSLILPICRTLLVSRALKQAKKSYTHLTTFFMSAVLDKWIAKNIKKNSRRLFLR